MPIKSWEHDKAAICDEIRSLPAPFKIVLKTKNEPYLLESWVDHHIKIVGAEGLVIFDNGSTVESVVRYIDKISETIPIYRFLSMHNEIHRVDRLFRELYAALRASCKYYTLIDTDERLFWANDDGSYLENHDIARRIVDSSQPVLPGIWAENHPGEDRKLRLTFRNNRIRAGIRSGKPIVSTDSEVTGLIAHNCQIPIECYDSAPIGNVIVAHLKNLSREQRIAGNIEKLASYNRATNVLGNIGLEGDFFTVEQILSVDGDRLRGNAAGYVKEIQRLAVNDSADRPDQPQNVPAIDFQNGTMSFVNKREKSEILEFLSDPAAIIGDVLRTPR